MSTSTTTHTNTATALTNCATPDGELTVNVAASISGSSNNNSAAGHSVTSHHSSSNQNINTGHLTPQNNSGGTSPGAATVPGNNIIPGGAATTTTVNNNSSSNLRWHSRSGSNCSDGSRFEVPTTTEGPRYQLQQQTVSQRRYVVVMVGLPARGKTFIAQKLCRMLAWLGHGAVVHNVQAVYRASLNPPRRLELRDFDFRDPNSDVVSNYLRALDRVGQQVKDFFTQRNGLVAFVNDDFVAKTIREEIERRIGVHADQTIYIEVTRDAEVNIQNDLEKILNPREFGHVTSEAALQEARRKFYERVDLLRQQYAPVAETARSFITLHNSRHLHACNVRGYLPSRLTSVLLNLGTQKMRYPIYFSRHGESEYNLEDRIGGNPPLTEKGMQDALYLRDFVGIVVADYKRRQASGINPDEPPPQIWSSQLTRTIQTSQPAVDAFGLERLTWHNLNEIHAGVCEDLTYAEVKERYPSIDHFRAQAKYSFRYPQGESYQDIVQRLEPLILELENAEREIVVVAHQAILRALLSYFGHKSAESSVHQTVPHRTIWRCTYNSDGISFLDELALPLEASSLSQVPTASSSAAAHGHTNANHAPNCLNNGALSAAAAVAAAAALSPTSAEIQQNNLHSRMLLSQSGMLNNGDGCSSLSSGTQSPNAKYDVYAVPESPPGLSVTSPGK